MWASRSSDGLRLETLPEAKSIAATDASVPVMASSPTVPRTAASIGPEVSAKDEPSPAAVALPVEAAPEGTGVSVM